MPCESYLTSIKNKSLVYELFIYQMIAPLKKKKKINFLFKDTYTQYFDKFEWLFGFWKCPNIVVGE